MTEALAAIPFFITIFACTVFAERVYVVKMRTIAESERVAWTNALHGCESSDGENLFDAFDGNLGEASGGPQTDLVKRGFGGAVATSNGSAVAPGYIGGTALGITSTTKVVCNEIKKKGDPMAMGGFFSDRIRGSW